MVSHICDINFAAINKCGFNSSETNFSEMAKFLKLQCSSPNLDDINHTVVYMMKKKTKEKENCTFLLSFFIFLFICGFYWSLF